LEYIDTETGKRYLPYVIEPSVGVDRLLLAVVASAYDEQLLDNGETREVLRFKPALAPVKVAVLPLTNKQKDKALEVFNALVSEVTAEFDSSGNIGKRYRRQDAIGTPFCVTYDYDSENDASVTVRERDSMAQERIKIADLTKYIVEKTR
jgi:glycyl-tRNA synthetase